MLVKIAKYLGFCVYRRSYLLWPPVIVVRGGAVFVMGAGIELIGGWPPVGTSGVNENMFAEQG